MAELLALYPGAQRALFRSYHIGGCSSCGFRPDETVEQVCARNGDLDPSVVLETVQADHANEEKMLVSPEDLQVAVVRGEATLMDIRTREEFDAVHIPGSRHFTQELMQEVLSSWPKNDLLVLIDHTGARSLDAAAYFAGHGLTNVKGLRGGIDAWSAEIDSSLPRYTLE